MPPRNFALDFSRSSYVCQSCLTSLRGVKPDSNPQLWLTRHASGLARRGQRRLEVAAAKAKASETQKPPVDPKTNEELQKLITQLQNGELPDSVDLSVLEAADVPDGSLDVRYFEQTPDGQKRQLSSDGFNRSTYGLDTEVEDAINDLERQMVATLQMLNRLEKQGMPDKAEVLRRQFKTSLKRQYKGKTGPEAEEYGLLRISGFSGSKHRAIASLNSFLARESVVKGGVPKHKDLVDCWKAYSAARKSLSSAWQNVPREVWDFLWMILSWEKGVENPNRMHHLYVLAKDMKAAGVALKDPQQLLAIEAMFIEGWKEEAIEAWKKSVVTIGSKPETFTGYYELGVRMLSLHGDVERAQRAAETLFGSAEKADARILIPIIKALAAKEATAEKAWETYRHMRDLLGEDMKLQDYDEVISLFLGANCMEHALQAFVDMMFSGKVDIRGRTRLPIAVSNQFFIGKWLKRLIGAGDLDGAYKVVVYLQDKGASASPRQLNGLIGAWMRTEAAENLEKAEDLAWNMIRSRLNYVHMRGRGSSMHQPTRLYDPYPYKRSPSTEEGDFHCSTRATAETFSILAENYASRGLHETLEQLWGAFQHAAIGPTSFLMNQLLTSYSQDGKADKAIDVYRDMTTNQNVNPDAYTFLALFNTLSVNRLLVRDSELAARDVQRGREFFADMVRADWKFDSPNIFHLLPRTIMFSMLKAQDYAGMIVAAQAMKELFDFTPPGPLLIELAAGTATLRVQSKRNIALVMEANNLVDNLILQHRTNLAKRGVDVDNLTRAQKAEEVHHVLRNLILVKAKVQDVPPEKLEPHLELAANEMSVSGILGDAGQVAKHRKIIGHVEDVM
ncbi:hypothetical protein QBC34DRAFT_405092 [Podospora aff. communis PSN243]|uniref:Pentatricopeptide repeat-containing protein n=1 Tax=Podospora aff. communis PSN243 TaxID=3040156 RepID=A0AAV9GND7_9PEZI|nr:hypothetical protein QBC34DRAFT_405092 [Podospora aff. communis PSN243]